MTKFSLANFFLLLLDQALQPFGLLVEALPFFLRVHDAGKVIGLVHEDCAIEGGAPLRDPGPKLPVPGNRVLQLFVELRHDPVQRTDLALHLDHVRADAFATARGEAAIEVE
ncbi:MAG: hypothetical protein IIB54_12830, partial [Planctomycetes bacterium]|nr:hypothetical protein [Planctomycetota bacterium]